MKADSSPATVFVTGGMSGLGRALAVQYLRRGANVAIFDLVVDQAVLEELELCRKHPTQKIMAYRASVTEFEALSASVQSAVDAIGSPQLAINCAGLQRANPFSVLSQSDFELVLQVNVCGSRNFAAAVLPQMRPGSRLALVASMAGFTPNYSYAAYSASKFAVIGLGKVLRLEYKPLGIEVSLICPPEVDTPMVVAEMQNMHPASRKLKDLAGSLSLEEAIRAIMVGLDAGKGTIIPGSKAKLAYFGSRYLPDFILNSFVDRVVRSVLLTMEKQDTTTTRQS